MHETSEVAPLKTLMSLEIVVRIQAVQIKMKHDEIGKLDYHKDAPTEVYQWAEKWKPLVNRLDP